MRDRAATEHFVFAWCALLMLAAAGCSRSRPQAAAAPQPPLVEFVAQWGMPGNDPGQLNDPIGPAVDDIGRVYLVDRSAEALDKFETGGVPLLSFDYSSFRSAGAIAVDRGGGIYVADTRAGVVQIFFPEGDFIRSFHIAPQRDWRGPLSFSVDDGGKVFVPDPLGGRIQVLDSHGRLERAWKVPGAAAGQASRPSFAVAAPDGFVYVGEWQSGAIVKYAAEGQQIAAFGAGGGSAAPLLGLAVSTKYVFALRDGSPRLEIWTLDGHLKVTDDLGGRLDAASPSTSSPGKASLAVTLQDDVVILDPAVPRVLRFRTHLDTP